MRRSPLLLSALALTGPLALAQTATQHATTAGTAHKAAPAAQASQTPATAAQTSPATTATPPCATLPTISPSIPALPASAGCPKVMFTVSDRLDYINPLADRFKSTLFSELPIVISLAYAEIQTGTGELAKPQQYYTVKYTGYLPDGTKFDSSDDHEETSKGFTFPYGAHRVIAGWDLGFEGMHIGGKRRLYVPYQFAYGAQGQPPKIPPKSMLIFDMELLAQSSTPPAPPTPPAAPAGTPGAAPVPGGAPSPAPNPAPGGTAPSARPVSPDAPAPATPPAAAGTPNTPK